jgi:hypothetical protein
MRISFVWLELMKLIILLTVKEVWFVGLDLWKVGGSWKVFAYNLGRCDGWDFIMFEEDEVLALKKLLLFWLVL